MLSKRPVWNWSHIWMAWSIHSLTLDSTVPYHCCLPYHCVLACSSMSFLTWLLSTAFPRPVLTAEAPDWPKSLKQQNHPLQPTVLEIYLLENRLACFSCKDSSIHSVKPDDVSTTLPPGMVDILLYWQVNMTSVTHTSWEEKKYSPYLVLLLSLHVMNLFVLTKG